MDRYIRSDDSDAVDAYTQLAHDAHTAADGLGGPHDASAAGRALRNMARQFHRLADYHRAAGQAAYEATAVVVDELLGRAHRPSPPADNTLSGTRDQHGRHPAQQHYGCAQQPCPFEH